MTKPPSSKPPTAGRSNAGAPPLTASAIITALSTPPPPSATLASPPKPATKPTLIKPSAKPSPASSHTPKTFAIHVVKPGSEGEKACVFGKSGSGKTTLAAQIPNAIFLGIDDGFRKIANPKTGEPIRTIPGIEGFQDLRDALHQKNLWPDDCSIVLDTVTKYESLAEPYIFEHYKHQGKTVPNLRGYGWDGPAHQLDVMRLLLSDFEEHVRGGRNIILLAQLAQVRVANAEGMDYLEDGPKLQHNNQYSSRTELVEWCDHVARIGYQEFNVTKENDKAKVGKVTSTDATRAIYTGGAQHFIAKSRPVTKNRETPYMIPAVISFASPEDDSFWQYIFQGAVAE